MRDECFAVCMWDMDTEEERQRLTAGIRNEVLPKDIAHTMAAENYKRGDQKTSRNHEEYCAIHRGEELFGHICRMENNRLVKHLVFSIMDGQTRRGRPNKEWLDDVREWCQTDIHSLSRMAWDRVRWRSIVRNALDTNGHEPMEWWMDGWMGNYSTVYVDY